MCRADGRGEKAERGRCGRERACEGASGAWNWNAGSRGRGGVGWRPHHAFMQSSARTSINGQNSWPSTHKVRNWCISRREAAIIMKPATTSHLCIRLTGLAGTLLRAGVLPWCPPDALGCRAARQGPLSCSRERGAAT